MPSRYTEIWVFTIALILAANLSPHVLFLSVGVGIYSEHVVHGVNAEARVPRQARAFWTRLTAAFVGSFALILFGRAISAGATSVPLFVLYSLWLRAAAKCTVEEGAGAGGSYNLLRRQKISLARTRGLTESGAAYRFKGFLGAISLGRI